MQQQQLARRSGPLAVEASRLFDGIYISFLRLEANATTKDSGLWYRHKGSKWNRFLPNLLASTKLATPNLGMANKQTIYLVVSSSIARCAGGDVRKISTCCVWMQVEEKGLLEYSAATRHSFLPSSYTQRIISFVICFPFS